MSDFASMGVAQLAAGVRTGRIRAADVARDAIDRIARLDPTLNCCTSVFAVRAAQDAAAIDAAVERGEDPGPLAGVPVVVKNLFDVEGEITLAGARMRRDCPPATQDATAVRKLREAGALIVAATNMDEFAYGFTTENDHFGVTLNPRDTRRLAGGSSGGSAAAVAAGMAHLALGSDTNGSIRVPSSFCGIFGLKPTFGRLSRAGTIPFVASLDHIGPMARSVEDLALSFDVMQGPDPLDPACTDRPPHPVSPHLLDDADFRVGILGGWFRTQAEDQALEAVDAVGDHLGAHRFVELAQTQIARFAAFVITAAEGGNLHAENLRARPEEFDPATRDRLLAGALMPANILLQAQRFRRVYRETVRKAFEDYDVLLAPATPCAAIEIGQQMLKIGAVEMLARAHVGIFTQPLSFVGLPILTVPVPVRSGLSMGVQIIGAPWAEETIFKVAARLERAGLVSAPVAELMATA